MQSDTLQLPIQMFDILIQVNQKLWIDAAANIPVASASTQGQTLLRSGMR